MKKNKLIIIVFWFISCSTYVFANDSFEEWKINFKNYALKQGISLITLNRLINNSEFLPDVIKYDRYQPEFYEDTKTYISKRTSNKKLTIGYKIYKKNIDKINLISKKYDVDKNLLLSLMGIETNFGNYLGKMDIISSLATLSFDKRRSDFFTSELITLLKLIDNKVIDPNTLYGSWAGAFGNFQFMPSTIKNYAVDFDKDEIISLKQTEDSFASAANYLNKLGWKNSNPCFFKVKLKSNIPDRYLNISAKKIHSTKKVNYLKKYIQDFNYLENYNNLNAAIITPDAEIVENPDKLSPAYIIFDNYKLILKWNRSLRFALAVCTLKEKFKNEL
jgi:membrane-bound lytic murein transglycosylase B